MATAIPVNATTGVLGTGAEIECVIGASSRLGEIYAKGAALKVSLESGGTNDELTCTDIPAGVGWPIPIPATRGGQQARSSTFSVFVLQAAAAGNYAKFTVTS